ncbi:MAG: NADH-quinone oxidoreductase subunit N [Isosphaeraceae bacterium]
MNTFELTRRALFLLAPEILLLLSATTIMTLGAFVQAPRRVWCAIAVFASTLALGLLAVSGSSEFSPATYSAVVLNDRFAFFARLLILLSGFILFSLAHDQTEDSRAPEFFGSLLFVIAGAMIVSSANELVLLFVGLELVSIPTYILLYLPRRGEETLESATKYFFLSIFSSALLLFGMAYFYGLTGVSNLRAIADLSGRAVGVPFPGMALLAVLFMMAGLGFRVAAVPFHFYAPDVYQGSPAVLAALLSWVPKAVGFVVMLRTLTPLVSASAPSEALADQASLLAAIISMITMTLGNTVALSQNNLKRLLAYSSIAHAGYLMIGIAVGFNTRPGQTPVYFAGEAILFYLSAYALMTLGIFGVIILLNSDDRPVENVEDLSGLSQSHPFWALTLAFCLFSLAGIPPFLGFLGKFELFVAAFYAAGDGGRLLWWLAVVGILNSAIGAYYYLRILVVMYLQAPKGRPLQVTPAWPTALAVVACSVLSLALGLLPGPLIRATHLAALSATPTPLPTPAAAAAATTEARTPTVAVATPTD